MKNEECQSNFFEETKTGTKFQNCFSSERSFEEKCQKFMNTLDDVLHKCFKKIRIGKNWKSSSTDNEVQDLIMEKSKLSLSIPSIKCKLGKFIVENEIWRLEANISDICASRNAKVVLDYVKNLDASNGNFSQLGMWKLKKLLCPNQTDPPMAKRDRKGNLITSPFLLKKLYMDTYKERLRSSLSYWTYTV